MGDDLNTTQARALAELRPAALEDMDSENLAATWARLERLYKRAEHVGDAGPVCDAASFALQEMTSRGMEVPNGKLAAQARTCASLEHRLGMLPEVIPLEQGEVELACSVDGELGLTGGWRGRELVHAALVGAGIPVFEHGERIEAADTFCAIYDLALVRSPGASVGAPRAMQALTKAQGGAGAMLVVLAPPAVHDALERVGPAGRGGAGAGEPHVTLVYLGRTDALSRDDLEDLRRLAEAVCREHRPLTVSLSGAGRFAPGEDGVPVVALASAPGLSQLQADLERAASQVVRLPSAHGWVPHLTLGYVPEDGPGELPAVDSVPAWTASEVVLVAGDAVVASFPLAGHMPALRPEWEAASEEPPQAQISARAIACAAPEAQVIYYLVSEPGTVDAHGHRIEAEEIERAMHGYMAGGREVKLEHRDRITGRAVVVEGYVAPCDLHSFHGQVPPGGPIVEGSSIVAIHYTDPELWRELRDTQHGISWGGMAARIER